jgi:hypothetical protein
MGKKLDTQIALGKAYEILEHYGLESSFKIAPVQPEAVLWHSEDEEPFPLEKDREYVDLGGGNGAFVVFEDRMFTVLFLGSQAQENAEKWHKWVGDEDRADHVCESKTRDLLRECFGK